MRVVSMIIGLLFIVTVHAGNGGGTEPPFLPQCKEMVETAINKGANAFTKTMITRMAIELERQQKVASAEDGERCVIFQLMQNKIPFEQ